MDETLLRPSEDDHAAESPSRGWRRTALAVPPLVVTAFVLFGISATMGDDRIDRISDGCAWLPLSWGMWAASCGALFAAALALALQVGLRRYGRARGWARRRTWQGGLALGFAVLGVPALVLAAVAVYLTTSDQADYNAHRGQPICEGLAVPGTPGTPGTPGDRGAPGDPEPSAVADR
ncbi:hypothetical protein [Streptomyces sp. NPDC049040]|uniref:hypothetical protein n=1 Tax=Streptomyces sp. NPDC049040 TaxID=3365593 RepID=UPI003721F23F